MIGETISHYKILEKLGEGGMGVVYKAQDTKLDRLVALKFLPKQFSINKEEKKRFVHEAKAAAALDHTNICAVYEIDETKDGQMFIAMANYEGKTLKDKIASGPLPIAEAINMSIQAAQGLQRAHESNIIHRDIKSANIIVTKRNEVKILDFGLAKLKGVTKLTKEGSTMGTIDYMSPEQASGEKVDHRSDIWSLGVLLYEMVTGQLPFKGEYEQAIMYSIMNEEPEPVTALRTGVPMELERIINKSLAKEPQERYQGTADLVVDLKKVKKDSKPEVKISKKKTSPEITLKTSRKMLVLGGIFLAAIIIVVAYFLFKEEPESGMPVFKTDEKPSIAIVYFENKSGDEKLDNWRDAFSELLTTDLSQSKYIRVLRSDEIYGIFKKLDLLEAKRYSAGDLKEIAKNGRVNHILKGSYIKAGDNIMITAMLINVSTGETISSLSVKAEGEKDIFPKVDELTKEIKLKLNLSKEQISREMDKEVGKISTSSPEAYKYYIEGRRYLLSAEHQKSISLMEKAVNIDPEFAMAYRSMAIAYFKMGYESEYRKYLLKAIKSSDRLSEREKFVIQGDFYKSSEKTWDKAFEVLKKVIQLYPEDSLANIKLGILYAHLEEFDKAIERIEVLIHNKDKSFVPYCNLSCYYQKKGLYEKAREILEYYLNNFQDHYLIRLFLAENYAIQRKFVIALSEVEKALLMVPHLPRPYYPKGDIYLLKGDFTNAEKTFRTLLEFPDIITQKIALLKIGLALILQGQLSAADTQFKHALKISKENKRESLKIELNNHIGYIYFISEKYKECIKEFNKSLAIAKEINKPLYQEWGRYFTAISYLEMKSSTLIQKAEAELLEWVNDRMNKKLIRWYLLFQGKKELKKKNYPGAIEYFNQAVSLLAYQTYTFAFYNEYHALFLDPLALAYFRSGNLDESQKVYEKITNLTSGRIAFGDIYAKAFYQLGKIFEKKGWKGKAIENYKKFIELWKDCDPQFQPLIKDARNRVKELEGDQ